MIFYPMDTTECSRPWKWHAPDTCVGHSMRLNATDVASDKRATEWEKEQTHKSVTMAPTSRYLTERKYVMRKPLFSLEHSSILKKTHQQQHQQKETHVSTSGKDEGQHSAKINLLSRLEEDLNSVSNRIIPSDVAASHSASEEACSTLSAIPDVSTRLQHEEPFDGLTLTGSKSIQCGLSSNIVEFHKNDRPARLQLTSTVLYPTYTPTPHFSYSKRDKTTELKKQTICSLEGQSRRKNMSYHEANYWDCAIPKSLPTSSNRHAASWDPNREYQALLDYNYPLRPGQMDWKWDSTVFQGDSHQLNLQDSGIELDNLCTNSLSGSDLNLSNTIQTEAWERMDQKINSAGVDSSALVSRSLSSELFLDSLDLVMGKDVGNCHQGRSQHHHQYAQPSSSIAFIRATSALPQSQFVGADFDKEFWALPDQLEEVQLLTRQVKEVTAWLNRPLTAMCERVGSASPLLTRSQPEKEVAEEAGAKEQDAKKDDGRANMNTNKRSAAKSADHGHSEAARRSPSTWIESVGAGLTRDSLMEVETLAEQLCGIHLRDTHKGILEDQDQNCSLMQHIRMFCSLLEQYIHWLNKVSDKMDMLARPTVDKENMKRSLAEYQKFQQELSSHQHLISRVLQTGELLLGCMDGTSPLLRSTLLLIERQSRAMEYRTEHLSSILSATDNQTHLSEPSDPVQQDKLETSTK